VTSSDLHPQPQPEDAPIHPTVRGGVALWTLFVGFAMLMVGNGLNAAVLGVRTVDEGFGVRTTGVVMACYFAGFLLGPPVVLHLLSAVGHIRVFASLASAASCAVLVHLVWISPLSWGAMRVVFGFCMAGLFVVVESWLNDASTPSSRGRTLAVYGIVSMGGLAAGQLLIATGGADGPTLFLVASILVSMSFVPMALAASTDAPPVRVAARLGVRELMGVAPTGVIGMLMTGASHGIVLGLGAVYATAAGFGATRTAVFVAAPAIGALLLQLPIGWASDQVPRRGVIFVVSVAAAMTAGVLAMLDAGSVLVVPLMLVLGGFTFPLYSLLLSYTLDWARPGTAMGASGTLLRVNGAGAVLGPVVAGALMASLDRSALFWALVATHGTIALYVAYRLVAADGLPMERQGEFVPVPARATELAIRLTARPLNASRARLRPPGAASRDLSGSDPTGFISGRRW
jgi:MFS family permease